MEGRELMGLIACTIPELFDGAVRRFAQKTAVIYKEDTYTWRDLDVLSNIMANRFVDKGIARGDHVGLWGENSATWIVTFLALQKLGAVPVLLNFNYKERELVFGLYALLLRHDDKAKVCPTHPLFPGQ